MTKYTVSRGHAKVLDEFRGDRIVGDVYIINKDGRATYEVVISTIGDYCDCPAGIHGHNCKHLKIVYDYIGAEK